jgi:spermidine synthase
MTVSHIPAKSWLLALVALLFAASGATALIYEIVWYQLLQLAIGASAVSLGILLATFMGGLSLGSLLLRRLPRANAHPLKVYALIELGIGLCGLLVLWGLPLADRIYIAGLQSGLPGLLLRGLMASLMLLPPTMLMGASLPVMARFVDASPRGVSWWGGLYAANTLGAVGGCLAAGFYLLRLHDMAFATFCAAAFNLAIALLSMALSAAAPWRGSDRAPAGQGKAPRARGEGWTVYLVIALSGATALGAEVVWTRKLAMMFDGTVFAFSVILAVFLVGMAIGSAVGSVLSRFTPPRLALGLSQLLLAVGIAFAAHIINAVLPYKPEIIAPDGWMIAWGDLQRSAEALLLPALLWGVSFPLAMAAANAGNDPARPVGRVYAANSLGGVIGALGVSLVLIGWIGSQNTERLMIVTAALGGALLLAPLAWRERSVIIAAALVVALSSAGVLAWKVVPMPGNLVAYGRLLNTYARNSQLLEMVEGRNSSAAITRYEGALQISVSGHVEASNITVDMRLQRMIGHIPALLHPRTVKVLGIGFGAGVSAGSFTNYPSVKSITICEMEPKVPPTSSKYFAPFDNNVKNDPRTRIVYDDGRHFLLTTAEKFDIIASDPLDVWVKGTATIYSSDYFEQVKRHLNPGGYFTLYVPLYESDEATVKSEIATFFQVFPHGTIWANTSQGQGYDLVLMGQVDPLHIDIDVLEQKLRRPDFAKVARSMQEIGFHSATDMYSTYAGQEPDLRPWLKDAQINTDQNLRLMYLAGWGINSSIEDQLYRTLLRYRRPPQSLFGGSQAGMAQLFEEMSEGGPRYADN